MRIKPLHCNFILPSKGSAIAAAYDIFMPEPGKIPANGIVSVPLGFAAEVPVGYVALLLPRSGTGSKFGVELNNTCGVIDADYRGEWKATLRTKGGEEFEWNAGDRVIQFLLVPVLSVSLAVVEELSETERGEGGFGSTGQ